MKGRQAHLKECSRTSALAVRVSVEGGYVHADVTPFSVPCPTLPYPTLPYLALPYLSLPYLTLPYLTLPHLTLPYLTLLYISPSHGEITSSAVIQRISRSDLCRQYVMP